MMHFQTIYSEEDRLRSEHETAANRRSSGAEAVLFGNFEPNLLYCMNKDSSVASNTN